MKKMLMGLAVVLLSVATLMAQDAKDDNDEHKNRVITLVNKGSEPLYELVQKYTPGKYSTELSMDVNMELENSSGQKILNNLFIRNVCSYEVSAPDTKGIQTFFILIEEVEMSSTELGKISVSRKDAVEKKSADKEADAPSKLSVMREKLSAAVHASPSIVKIDAAGKVVSTANMPANSEIASSMKHIYEDMEETHLYPQIGVGGAICVEDDDTLQDMAKIRSSGIATLKSVETKGNQSLGHIVVTETAKEKAPEVASDEDESDAEAAPVKVSGKSAMNITLDLKSGLLMEETGEGTMNITIGTPQGDMLMKMQAKVNLRTSRK